MDHKVSKDMISSGMIPSGEKTQADLSRTQYGTAPSPSKLMDAYKSMYEHHQKDKDGNTIPHEGEEVKEENINELKSRTMLDYIDKASDSASKELDKAKKTTSRKKEVKARLKMDKRERGIEMAKDKIMKRVTEEVDKFDIVFNHFISEGYSEKEAYAKMANLTEEQLDEFLQALAPLAKGMMAGAVKVGAKAKPIATNLAKQGKAMTKVDAIAKAKPMAKPMTTGGYKQPLKKATQGSLDLKGTGMKDTPQKSFSASSPSQVVDPKENLRARTGGNQFGDEIKRQTTQMAVNKMISGDGGGGKKERAKNISASADLFDIVKGKLLDEGMSEEEIKDIMLTLTPDEILNEISVGKMANYISAADKDVKKTADSIRKDGSVMGDDPRVKRMSNRGKGMAMAGDKIARKMTPSLMSLPRTEEYKGSGTPEQQAAMKAQIEVSKKVNRYGGKTPSGTTAVDAKKGIEDVRKSM